MQSSMRLVELDAAMERRDLARRIVAAEQMQMLRAPVFTPARASTSRTRTPPQRALPTAPYIHCTPGSDGSCSARPLPAHCSTHVASARGSFFRSASERLQRRATSPSTVSRHVFTSGMRGIQWLRTKKRSFGVR